jgi:translation elongation factor EF-Ts
MITINSEKADAQRKAAIETEIAALESGSIMNRGAREMAMRQIEERAQLDATAENTADQILAMQPFYVKLKQVDDQISALRVQL